MRTSSLSHALVAPRSEQPIGHRLFEHRWLFQTMNSQPIGRYFRKGKTEHVKTYPRRFCIDKSVEHEQAQKIVYTSRFVRVILAQGPC